jgi:hypothetical protein
MNALVPIALYGWALVVLVLFALLPKHRAVIVAFVVAWLILHFPINPIGQAACSMRPVTNR